MDALISRLAKLRAMTTKRGATSGEQSNAERLAQPLAERALKIRMDDWPMVPRRRQTNYECESCGFDVPMPTSIARYFRARDYRGDRNLCSTCASADWWRWKQQQDRQRYKPDKVLAPRNCDFCPSVGQCTGDCWRDLLGVPQKGKEKPRQGNLF